MYKVVTNKITYGRRTFEKGDVLKANAFPSAVMSALLKAKKIEKITKSEEKK